MKLIKERHEALALIILLLWLIGIMKLQIDTLYGGIYYLPYILFLLAGQKHMIGRWIKKVLVLEPFLMFMFLGYLWFERSPEMHYGLTLTLGTWHAILLFLKGTLTIGGVVAYTEISGINGITQGMYMLKIPHVFILIFMQTYRYIGLLKDKAQQMMRAYRLRSQHDARGIDISAWGSFPGQLFVLSLKQAEATHHAMTLRGYEIDKHYVASQNINRYQIVFGSLSIAYMLIGMLVF